MAFYRPDPFSVIVTSLPALLAVARWSDFARARRALVKVKTKAANFERINIHLTGGRGNVFWPNFLREFSE